MSNSDTLVMNKQSDFGTIMLIGYKSIHQKIETNLL